MTSTETTLQKPAWEIKGKSDLHGAHEAIGRKVECDRCQASLYAEVWYITETATGKVWNVGSGCVKTLTGRTVSQLHRDSQEYEAGMAEQEYSRGRARLFAEFAKVHEPELAFCDEHIARIQEAQDRYYASNPGIGGGNPPSAEWWEKLRMKAQAVGVWTVGELAAVRREMSLNHEAALPEKKSRDIYEGTVERVWVEEDPYSRSGGVISKLTLRPASGDVLYFLTVREGTELDRGLLKLAAARGWVGANDYPTREATKIKRRRAFEALGKISFKGTVKGTAATGGKVYFTRAALEAGA